MAFVGSFVARPVASPARSLVSSRPATLRVAKPARMSVAPLANDVIVKVSDVTSIMAAKEADFGGYTFPIIGLLIIGIIIAVLTPPVKD